MHEQEWTCAACGYTPASDAERDWHERGVDAARLECARQDIEAIKAEQEPAVTLFRRPWG